MEEDFYKGRMRERFGTDVLVPDKDERDFIDTGIECHAGQRHFCRELKTLRERSHEVSAFAKIAYRASWRGIDYARRGWIPT
jgi:aspartate/glutamate racemase